MPDHQASKEDEAYES